MWVEKSPGQRASRVAIAGSIYMRKASLEVIKSRQVPEYTENLGRRNPSYGKIVKNTSRKVDKKPLQQISNSYRKEFSPFLQKKSLISESIKIQLERKTPTPSFGHYDQFQNSKIKSIEQKYRAMLSQYEIKKKTINTELQTLRSSSKTDLRSRTSLSMDKPKFTQRQIGIKPNKQENKPTRNNQNILKQYEQRSKQLIVQKLATQSRNIASKRKQKITQVHPVFFKNLKNQIKLQQQFRLLKTSIKPQKKTELQKYLQQNQQTEALKVIDLDPEQFDPFENRANSETSLQVLAKKLIQKHKECEQQWKQTCTLSSKKDARQIFQGINFQKCNQITLKAFVRELSFLLEKHLRNRDLLRIYNRLSPLTEQNFCEITVLKD